MDNWYVIEKQCDSCGGSMVLRGPFPSEEEAKASPREWPTMTCIEVMATQVGVIVKPERYW